MEPKLIFTMELARKNHLITGNLQLEYDEMKVNYLATSGQAGRQTEDLLWKRGAGGAIPPGNYWIPTIGYFSSNPGIQGLFFHIQPDPASELGGRSELGIHWDARNPGTMGCIGIIRKVAFDRFCDRLEDLADKGIKKLNLEVRY